MAEIPPQPLFQILASLSKPLHFASKNNFARLNAVKGLEQLVFALCEEASSIDLPSGILHKINELEEIFKEFDNVLTDEKKQRINRSLEIIHGLQGEIPLLTSPGGRPGDASSEKRTGDVLKNLKRLSTPLRYIKGIGPKLGAMLEKKGLSTVEDVFYFLPIRCEDRRNIKSIAAIEPGKNGVTTGHIMASGEARYGKRKLFEAVISDGTGFLKLKWFNYRHAYMKKIYAIGHRLIVYGSVSAFGRQKEIIHPDVEFIEPQEEVSTGGIVPVYSQMENLHQKTIRKIIRGIIEEYAAYAQSGAPEGALKRHGFMELKEALLNAHAAIAPAGEFEEAMALARKSLTFDELFSLELGMALKRKEIKKQDGVKIAAKGVFEKKLMTLLPFTLTKAQERVIEEIKKDIGSPHPMNRLIQGDVGSGKTIVSYIVIITAIESGCQSALMAPTEILAEQHYLTTRHYSESLGIKTVLLTGSISKKERGKAIEAIRQGSVDFIIGTHALIQKDVEFKRLGLVVIDEQHRFGVVQRGELKKKGNKGDSPHILVMTATPIPRTLAMTVFGDLDVSTIDELPKGRTPVVTRILREKDRGESYGIIREELKRGGQAYIVYPLIEESEELPLRDATRMKEHLERDIFKEFSVGLLHGKMNWDEKEEVMRKFKNKSLDILVSTTVIEVGVDVPNATVMLVEHAERFGLAQLHQLRGRIGRGDRRSICLLLAQWSSAEDTWRRLKVLEGTTDGFKIAEEDLNIRGSGDFIGTRQSGMPEFRLFDMIRDARLLKIARDEAMEFLKKDPELASPEAKRIKAVLSLRWRDRLSFAEIG